MHQRPMFDEKLVNRFEYDIDIIKYIDGQPNKTLDKLVIHPIEVGNRLEFKSTNDSSISFFIPIDDITEVNTPGQIEGSPEKKDLLLEIEFKESQGNKKSIAFTVSDKYIEQVLVKTLKPMEQKYWDAVDLRYNLGGMIKTAQIYYKTPFLSDDEELLWINTKIEGITNKHIRWLEALTNFRAVYYDFEKHECSRIALSFVDDVIVKNEVRTYESNRFGNFTGGGRAFAGKEMDESYGPSRMIGDVLFMRDGKPIVTFVQVSDPHELASLAKAVIEQLFTPLKTGKTRQLPMAGVRTRGTDDSVCAYCGNVNPSGSKFCNKCGF